MSTLIIRFIHGVRFSLPFSKALFWFVVSGLFTGGAFLFMFLALHMERVIIVSPIVSSYSVFVLLLSPIIARSIETITLRKTVGAVVVVAGVFLIAIGRNY